MWLSSTLMALSPWACIVYGIILFTCNSEWLDYYTLYTSNVKKHTNSTRINCLLGSELVSKIAAAESDPMRQRQIREEGIAYLNKAERILPGYMDVENYLGYAYLYNQQYDSAEVHCEKALILNPDNVMLANNLAGLYVMNKKFDKGIRLYSRLLRVNHAMQGHMQTSASATAIWVNTTRPYIMLTEP